MVFNWQKGKVLWTQGICLFVMNKPCFLQNKVSTPETANHSFMFINIQLQTSPKYQSSESKGWHSRKESHHLSQWFSARLFISQGPSFLGSCKHHFTVLHTCRSKSHGAPALGLPSQSSLFLEQFFPPLHAYPVIIIPCTKSKHQFYSSYIPKLLDKV